MQEKAKRCYQTHRASFDFWSYGEIDQVWNDENGILCIRYSSGSWWHYDIVDGEVIWW